MARVGPPPERLHELMVGNGKNVTNRGCGTVQYIAPEVFRGEEYAYGVDVWAFGVIMYELLLEKVSSIFKGVRHGILIRYGLHSFHGRYSGRLTRI